MHKFNIAMKFEEAIQKIQYGKCLLLTGAGLVTTTDSISEADSASVISKEVRLPTAKV